MRDALILLVAGLLLWAVAHLNDLGDGVIAYLEANEDLELDELALAILISGLFGFIYAYRRLLDQRAEMRARLKAEADSAWIARHDSLTRLPNRSMLEQFVADASGARAGAQRHVIFAIDPAGFKQVNHRLGYDGGNKLLVMLADRLRTLFPDEFVGRLGADEFIIISRQRTDDLLEAGQALSRDIERPFELGANTLQISANIGIAACPDHGASLAQCLRFAEMALHNAKRDGRSIVRVFDSTMDLERVRRAAAEAALRAAIDNGEIVPWYQPQVDLTTGEVVAFEALARWVRPDGEIIPPADFIELAEQSGLITPLTEQLLRQACRDARAWPEPLTLAINISPVQLCDRMLPLRLDRLLAETGLPPTQLEVEITESAIMDDIDSALEIVDSLHASGIRIALDDFGTGYSSLAQLSRLPIDKLKIDRSFVDGLAGASKQAKIVKAMVSLGHGLGLVTTAEGIEHDGEWERLGLMGCTHGQGYLFSRPMPAEQVGPWLVDYQIEQSLAHAG